MSTTLQEDHWHGEDVSIAEIERQLGAMRASALPGEPSGLRTSVMTHTAWVPRNWLDAARGTLAGLAEMHPSRTILLVPEPDAGRDGLDVDLSVQCFPIESETRHVCTEVIELHLLGTRAAVPASIVEPLLVSDLPVFSRWRGRPSFGASEFEQMMDVVDRLIVDSAEWPDVPEAYAEFQNCFERAAVSDIAWRRLLGWRVSLGAMWPGIVELDAIAVKGPKADALLLVGWLRSRLGRKVELEVEDAEELESVAADGDAVPAPPGGHPDPSDLLSAELDEFGRDRIYEDALRAAA